MRLLKGFAWLSAAEVASKAATFAAFAWLARVAGPGGFGRVEFAAAVVLCAGMVVDLGFSAYGAREIARQPGRTAALIGEVVLARAVLAATACAGIVGLALLLVPDPLSRRLLVLYGLSLLLAPFLLQWVCQGLDQMGAVAAATLLRQAVFALAVLGLVRDAASIPLVALAEIAGVGAAVLYCVWRCRAQAGEALRRRPRVSRTLLTEGVPIGLGQMFWAGRVFAGTILLGVIAGAAEVGWFGGAQRLFVAAHAFVWLYFFNLFPSLSRDWQAGADALNRRLERSAHLTAWLAGGAATAWVIIAADVVRIVYGPSFGPSAAALRWMAGVWFVAAMSGHYRFALIAAGRQTIELLVALVGLCSAAAFIPLGFRLRGVEGAAIGLLAAEAVVWAGAWLAARARLGAPGQLRTLVRPVGLAIVSVAVAQSLPVDGSAARAAICVAVFALGAAVLDAGLRHELRRFVGAGRRSGARAAVAASPSVKPASLGVDPPR